MTPTQIELSVHVAAAPDVVRQVVANLEEYDRIHPLIVSVRRLRDNHYQIRDRMRVGPMTISFTYRVTSTVTDVGEIVSDAYQFPRIHLHNITTCEAESAGTRVHERVEITAPWPLRAYVHRTAQRAHRTMLDNLARSF